MEVHSERMVMYPVNSVDLGQQKCKLNIETVRKLGAPVGSYMRIALKETSFVCSIWPNNLCSDSSVLKLDMSVFTGQYSYKFDELRIIGGLDQSSIGRLQPLTVSDTKCANLTVIVKAVDKYLNWKKLPSVQNSLKQKCVRCLRKKCVVENCTVTMKTSKLGKAYGIVFIHINKLKTNSDSEGGIITESTEFHIDNIQSEERYMLLDRSAPADVGGVNRIAGELQDLLHLPLKHSEDFAHLGLPLPKGILLQGPPGCGKTSLVRNLAQSSQAALVILNGPEILSPNPGESEENVRKVFQTALRLSLEGPCILFIDEIDSVCPRRGKSGSSNNSNVTSALMSAMDDLSQNKGLVVIGATNRASALDPSLRRPGRFDREIMINVPSRDQREEILTIHSRRLPLAHDVDLDLLSDLTNGYVGADLASLCNEAAYRAMERQMSGSVDELKMIKVTIELGHSASIRKELTAEGFTHDWTFFVRGTNGSKIEHFIEKVVFKLHETSSQQNRTVTEPPYQVSESGCDGFPLLVDVYFRDKDLLKISFLYDLYLNAEGEPPINHTRCEKLTIHNPTKEFRQKLLKGGGKADPRVEMSNFLSAIHSIIPSTQKGSEGIVNLQPVQWEEIGGLEEVKIQIKQAVEWPMLYPEAFARMGLAPPRGVLLYGPPGCCKTTLVRAAATATRAAFVALSGAQLYSPFVGDSERMVTEVFQKCRAMSPTILFLDEIDSIVGKRSEGRSHRGVQERVLSTLLNEMDGIGVRLDTKTDPVISAREAEGAKDSKNFQEHKKLVDNNKVLVVAATNRPDLVDEAILRPGRIDRIIYVPPPDHLTRLEILRVHTRAMPLENVDLDHIARKTSFYTGADLENLCKEAALCSLTESLGAVSVTRSDFTSALNIVKPSLSPELVEKYRSLGDKYRAN